MSARFLHVACRVAMIPDAVAAKAGIRSAPPVPAIETKGHTYNVGRNADKRARRAAHGVRK